MSECVAFVRSKLGQLSKMGLLLVWGIFLYILFFGIKLYEVTLDPAACIAVSLIGHMLVWGLAILVVYLTIQRDCRFMCLDGGKWRFYASSGAGLFQFIVMIAVMILRQTGGLKPETSGQLVLLEVGQMIAILLCWFLHVCVCKMIPFCKLSFARPRVNPPTPTGHETETFL